MQLSPAVTGEVISGRGHDSVEEVAESAEGERCLANLDEKVMELDKDVGIVDLGVDAVLLTDQEKARQQFEEDVVMPTQADTG